LGKALDSENKFLLEPQDASLSVFLSAQRIYWNRISIGGYKQDFLGMGSKYKYMDTKSGFWRKCKGVGCWIFHRYKGYIGTGADNLNGDLKDFWE